MNEHKEIRIVKVTADDNCSREFLSKYRIIIEWWCNGKVEYAEPLSSMNEVWAYLDGKESITIQVNPPQNSSPKLYGWYSREAESGWGFAIYERTNGEGVVKVTHVSKNPSGNDYHWSDKIPVGELGELIHSRMEPE